LNFYPEGDFAMTRKDYKKIAEVLREGRPERQQDHKDFAIRQWSNGARDAWETIVIRMARMLAADNPRLDKEKFVAACRKEEE
jgi:hypothetical protein